MARRLNTEQQRALTAVQGGKSIFLTGAGGTGKSHTIRAITEWASAAGLRYTVTAMTGCAALLLGLGSKTLHSWAGVGLARESPHDLANQIRKNKRANRRWLDTQLLIIDEISMMTPELLEKLDCIARRVRNKSTTKFGGLQLVLAGDFCQLPPVQKATDAPIFAFESEIWKTLVDETIILQRLERQTDPVFQKILLEARMGILTRDSIAVLESRMNLPWQDNEIRPTLLFSRNAEVDKINRCNLDMLEGECRIFTVQTTVLEKPNDRMMVFPTDPEVKVALEKMDTDAPYEVSLELRVGAQVMLLVNLDQEAGMVNGSRGVVVGYTPGGLPQVRFLSSSVPIVIDRHSWWLADYEGIGRSQIPLKVAYAITIHKSQGATLDSALIDIGNNTFEYGQAYVALSRVRSLDGLYVWKFNPSKVRCHDSVVAFYKALEAAMEPSVVEEDVAEAHQTSQPPSLESFAYSPPAPAYEPEDPTPHPVLAEAEEEKAPPPPQLPWSLDGLSKDWVDLIDAYTQTPKGSQLVTTLRARSQMEAIAPAPYDVFAALRFCPNPADVRVILLGQDPYPTAGNAHGLSFSVPSTLTKLPASLQNIYKELASDLSTAPPTTGCLEAWAKQGVLLLNDVLTVRVGAPQSHAGIGWEDLTLKFLQAVVDTAPHVVLILWGRNAQRKLTHLDVERHTVLQAPHPSPLSAYTGFFGSRPFSKANAALVAHNQTPIAWI